MNGVHAIDFLQPHEQAVVIFTRRWNGMLQIMPNGTGLTGNWRIARWRRRRTPDRVVLYVREHRRGEASLFIAQCDGIEESAEAGRSVVRFSQTQRVGSTELPWTTFSGARVPVRFISPPDSLGRV